MQISFNLVKLGMLEHISLEIKNLLSKETCLAGLSRWIVKWKVELKNAVSFNNLDALFWALNVLILFTYQHIGKAKDLHCCTVNKNQQNYNSFIVSPKAAKFFAKFSLRFKGELEKMLLYDFYNVHLHLYFEF